MSALQLRQLWADHDTFLMRKGVTWRKFQEAYKRHGANYVMFLCGEAG